MPPRVNKMVKTTYTIILTLLSLLPMTVQAQIDCHKILHHYERVHAPETWDYDWTTAIFLYGALTYTQKNPDILWGPEKVKQKFSMLETKAPLISTPDLASMSLPATIVGNEKMISLTQSYFATEPLNAIGAIDHVGKRHFFSWFVDSSLWADSIIMYALNGYKIAKLKRDQDKEKFFIEQFYLFEKYLRDPLTGLYKHAYYVRSHEVVPEKHFWARGNLWITLGLIEVLEHYPAEKMKLMFTDHIKALARYADREKGLRTLMDDPTTNFETSATALFAYALKKGIRLGVLENSYQSLAQDMTLAAEKNVVIVNEDEQSVTNISGPTTAMKWPWYYKYFVGTREDESYGVGAVLLLCSE